MCVQPATSAVGFGVSGHVESEERYLQKSAFELSLGG